MGSSTRARDFTAFDESNFPGMLVPEHFNNNQDAGDGFPGLQGAVRNWVTWWLHSGNMDSGLHIAGYDITGANLVYADKIYNAGDLTGTATSTISGYGTITGGSGYFTQLTGINTLITTANIINAVITNATQYTGGTMVLTAGELKVGAYKLTNGNWSSLFNIGSHTIEAGDWKRITGLQNLGTTNTPTFAGLNMNGNIVMGSDDITFSAGGTVDGVDVGAHAAASNPHSTSLTQLTSYNHNDLANKNAGTSYEHISAVTSGLIGTNNAHISANGSSHGYINQSLLTNNTVTFSAVNAGTINSSTNLDLNAGVGYNVQLNAGGQSRWKVWDDGDFKPFAGNSYDIGDATYDVKTLYYCNISETSCADFSDKTLDEIYNLFAQIRPRTDDIVHKTKDMTYKHIDFATIPDEFAHKAEEDFIKDGYFKMKAGIEPGKTTDDDIEATTVNYKKGDNCAIAMSPYIHALRDFTVKLYEQNKVLEDRIAILEGV